MRLDPAALMMPARHATRSVALDLLRDASEAYAALCDARSEKSLHEFRVALRRLRSWLRAYQPELGDSVSGKDLRRLRRSARATSASRDLDVQHKWVESQRHTMGRTHQAGVRWLLRRLEARKRDADAALFRKVGGAFSSHVDELEEQIGHLVVRPDDTTAGSTLARVTADVLTERSARFAMRLAEIESLEDTAAIHEARIAGKRVRCVLEPYVEVIPAAQAAVETLKEFQDTSGELNDAAIIGGEVARGAAAAAKKHARRLVAAVMDGAPVSEARRAGRRGDPRAGLLELAVRLRRRREDAFSELRDRWLGAGSAQLLEDLHQLAAQLASWTPFDAPAGDDALPERVGTALGAGADEAPSAALNLVR